MPIYSATSIQTLPPHSISWRSILILSAHLRLVLPTGLFPSGLPTETLYEPLVSPLQATCLAYLILLDYYDSLGDQIFFNNGLNWLSSHNVSGRWMKYEYGALVEW